MVQKLYCVFLFFFLIFSIDAQVVFTYGNNTVSKQEFLRAYEKNETVGNPTRKSFEDYLELYIRFKLKVQAARDMKLDTLVSQHAELENFRAQIMPSFLNDEASVNVLIDQAFERNKKDIHIAHVFIPAAGDASKADIQKAQNDISAAYNELAGGRSFSSVALKYSKDPTVVSNQGDIGFITCFVLPYEMEDVAYSLKPGEFSKPFKTKSGFHIIKNIEERKAIGKVHVAQILLGFPPDATESKKAELKKLADSLYTIIVNGGDFGALAKTFSTDNWSYQTGGELPPFGIGSFSREFESAAFGLDHDGSVSLPVLTDFGYHIIKRIERLPVNENASDKKYRELLRRDVESSDRMEVAKKALQKKIRDIIKYTPAAYDKNAWLQISDSVVHFAGYGSVKGINDKTPLFFFDSNPVTLADWVVFLETNRTLVKNIHTDLADIFDQFLDFSTLKYYQENLEKYNQDFKNQLEEFRQGNLLFEVMQRKVWDAASNDTAALRQYYKNNAAKYWWEKSADAIIFTVSNADAAASIRKQLESDISGWRKVLSLNESMLQADSGRFELSQIPVAERTNFLPGLFTANVDNKADKTVAFAYIVRLHDDHEPRSFDDARGFVINDYQNWLEEKWISELKKKYPVKVNKRVFNSLTKK